jgi:hypothetical protein
LIGCLVFIEKFGWGFGAVGHMLYMMQQIAPGKYKTAHYAFATGLMGLCMTTTGLLSGVIAESVGYQAFFLVVLVAAAPSLIATLTAPFIHAEDDPENHGKKRYVLAGSKKALALTLVLVVTGGGGIIAIQRSQTYRAQQAELSANPAACLQGNDRVACFFQCKQHNPKACLHLSGLFSQDAPWQQRAQVLALPGDAQRQHKYQRRQAFEWYQAHLSQTCDQASGKPEQLQACHELGLIIDVPAKAKGKKVEDPCAPDLELNPARARWCDVAPPDADTAQNWFTKACADGKGVAQACQLVKQPK